MQTGSRQHADGIEAVGLDRVNWDEKRSMKGREDKVEPLLTAVVQPGATPGECDTTC